MTDVPFEIPDSWEWVKLGDIFKITMGQSPDGRNVNDSNGVEFHQGKINFTDKYLAISDSYTTEITKLVEAETILLCVRAPVGIYNITPRQICIGRGLCGLKPLFNMNSNFWFYFLQFLKDYFEENATGTTFKSINGNLVSNALIPLPPLAEQKRIVDKIEEIFASLDEISLHLV